MLTVYDHVKQHQAQFLSFLCFLGQVFIAQSRSSGSHRDVEDEELTRIFVMIPKTFTEEDLKDTFKVFFRIIGLVYIYSFISIDWWY